jgi:hypothetical protein
VRFEGGVAIGDVKVGAVEDSGCGSRGRKMTKAIIMRRDLRSFVFH